MASSRIPPPTHSVRTSPTIKRTGTTIAVLSLVIAGLTACAPEKLSTEETCTYLNDKGKEADIAQKLDEAGAKSYAGDFETVKASYEEYSAILKDSAGKTEDTQLADAMNAAAGYGNQLSEILTSEDLSMMEKSSQAQALNTADARQRLAYMDEACPNLDGVRK
ncbi:hypothetical protein [Glutamicibacter sp. JC586]|uniref:hypothetical protein n=1 Tax=Glutamicibacter sp. JC586 TaxID=2590552 RepID=UPI00135B680B|nr:hypothetical protein [Glutamicibacter sp. JC586]